LRVKTAEHFDTNQYMTGSIT